MSCACQAVTPTHRDHDPAKAAFKALLDKEEALADKVSTMTSQDPVQEFNSLVQTHDFVFVLYYRGHWCPFCQAYLRTLESLRPRIEDAKGATLIVTAEEESFLSATREKTGYTGKALVDTKNELVKELKQRGIVDVAITEKKGYAHGMAQPAIVIIQRDGTVIERWAIVPSMMNMGGAKDRPDLEQVWENAHAKLEHKEVIHHSYKKQGALGVMRKAIFG